MAPKSSPLKRPVSAAASTKRAVKAKPGATAATKGSVGNAKKPLSGKKCKDLLNKLGNINGISDALRNDIKRRGAALVRGRNLRVGQEVATQTLSALSKEVEAELQAALQAAHVKIKSADEDKQARADAEVAAEARLAEVKQQLVNQKVALRKTEKALETNKEQIKSATVAQKLTEVQLKTVYNQKRKLESVQKDAYDPLKAAHAEGTEGQQRLSLLRKTGKAYGFHSEMLGVLPLVLKKQLDKRQTFDGLVTQYLDVEFARNLGSLAAKAEEGELSIADRVSQLQQAQEALQNAQEDKKQNTTALADAEASLAEGKEVLAEARRRSRTFPADMKKAVNELTAARSRSDRFRNSTAVAMAKALPMDVATKTAAEDSDADSDFTMVVGAD